MNPVFFKPSQHLQDYLEQKTNLNPFYAQPLYPDWHSVSGKVKNNFNQQEIVDELIAQNSHKDFPEIKKNIALLKKENTLIVITGQQMGLFISPLYTVFKSLSTILLCEKLNRDVKDFNYVPVFWLEGEDNDFDEVSSLKILSKSGELQKFKLDESPKENGFSMNRRVVTQDFVNIINSLKESSIETEFSEKLFNRLEQLYKNGSFWIDSFSEHLDVLLGDLGLLHFNAGSQKIKELSRTFFEKILIENEVLVSAFSSTSHDLKKAGYQNQVPVLPDRSYLFLSYENGKRRILERQNNSFFLKDSNLQFSLDEMFSMLDENPEWFSSSVLTRPLWQSWLLPVVSYVAGAAEIAYWGQLRGGFNHLEIVMPQLQPRHTFTIIEPQIKRLISKYNIDILKVSPDKEEFIKHYFSQNKMGDVNGAFAEFESQIRKSRDVVKELVEEIDNTLIKPTEKSYSSITNTIKKLHGRLVQRVKEKDEITHRHLESIHNAIMPEGNLQERTLSSLYFENKYGPNWVKAVKEKLTENFSDHLIVEL